MAILEVKNLVKYFGKTQAVNGISFEVEKGEIFGFLGPNGAGKTTTIRCLMSFMKLTSGNVKIFDLDPQIQLSQINEGIGYLSGDVRLYDGWTGKEHIIFLENLRGQKSKAENLIRKLDFNPNVKFKTLSSGNKQKLGLILALMFEPELLVMDEPTVGLDPLLQSKIYELLEEAQTRGATIFMSSHNLPEVERLCSRVAIIKDGKIVTTENIQGLKNKRMHVLTAHFNGSYDKKDFEFDGVSIQQEIPGGLILDVKGDINPLLRKLASYELKDLEITHASLEEIFLEFYQGKEE
jgi:ABC-2 type transport system ATP-binding protein